MLKRSAVRRIAPWVPSPRLDELRKTVPPPPAVDLGGLDCDVHTYSDRLARTPHWKRMAHSDYGMRMRENATRYPFTRTPGLPSTDFGTEYLPVGIPDPMTRRPLLEVGHPFAIPTPRVPVIFLQDVLDEDGKSLGKRHETVYVCSNLMRERLHPSRLAVYATVDWYRRLGLPVRDHRIHQEIPKSLEAAVQLRKKQLWFEEPWRSSTFIRFFKYRDGPLELQDDATPWDSSEETPTGSSGAGEGRSAAGGQSGPKVFRKARKVKLF